MKLEELKKGKYYKVTNIGSSGNVSSYIKYETREDFSRAGTTFIKCIIAIYCDETIMSYRKNCILQAEIKSDKIMAPIFPISKTIFYKIIRKYNVFRRTKEGKML